LLLHQISEAVATKVVTCLQYSRKTVCFAQHLVLKTPFIAVFRRMMTKHFGQVNSIQRTLSLF